MKEDAKQQLLKSLAVIRRYIEKHQRWIEEMATMTAETQEEIDRLEEIYRQIDKIT